MKDDLKGIGTSGRAGRGNGSTSPSRAARTLAGPAAKKSATKKSAPAAKKSGSGTEPASAAQAEAATSATAKKAPAKAAAKKTPAQRTASATAAAKKVPPPKTTAATKAASAARKSGSGTEPASAAQAEAATSTAAKKAPAKKTPAQKTASATAAAKRASAPKSAATRSTSAQKAAPTAKKSGSGTKPTSAAQAEAATSATAKAASSKAPESQEPAVEPGSPTTGSQRERHLHAVPEDEAPPQEPPPEATADIDPEDVAAAFVDGARRLMGTDWQVKVVELLGSLRRRLSGAYEVDEFGLDPEVLDLLSHLVEPLAESWFRLEVRGVENIPTDGGALLVANHSGTVPVDGLITGYAVRKHTGRPIRPLGADLVFRLPYVGQIARKMGATLACAEDAERLLTSGQLAAVWPEGFKGVGKPYSERYKLQRFGRGGFVSSAMRAQVPIIPVSIVGAEEIYPLVGNIPSLARLLGLPYIPITPFFPLFGPLGLIPLPSKWIIEFGEPIRTDAYAPESADDPMLLFNVTDQVRETIQQTLYNLLVDRGNPFV